MRTKKKRPDVKTGKHRMFDGKTAHTAGKRADARRRRGHGGDWLRRCPTLRDGQISGKGK